MVSSSTLTHFVGSFIVIVSQEGFARKSMTIGMVC